MAMGVSPTNSGDAEQGRREVRGVLPCHELPLTLTVACARAVFSSLLSPARVLEGESGLPPEANGLTSFGHGRPGFIARSNGAELKRSLALGGGIGSGAFPVWARLSRPFLASEPHCWSGRSVLVGWR